MPQELLQMLNPWARRQTDGSGVLPTRILEPQRTDLFTVDFGPVIKAVQPILSGAQSSRARALATALPNPANARFYVNGVDFPEARTSVSTSKRHEQPFPWPSNDEVLSQFTLTFWQDICLEEFSISSVVAFLYGWRAIVRAGRPGVSDSDIPLSLIEAGVGTLIPAYRYDFYIEQWRGRNTDPALEVGLGTDGQSALELSHRWKVVRGWISGVQPNAIRHAQAQAQEVRATFCADAVVPDTVSAGNVIIGTPIVLGQVAFNPQDVQL